MKTDVIAGETPFETPFQTLVAAMETSWAQTGYAPQEFTNLATENLAKLSYQLDLKQLNGLLTKWLLTANRLPEQVNVHNTFGQPPITVFNNGKFVVDIYIWRGCDTSIHSHGFRGAFRVLHGHSLHEVFDVETESIVAPDVLLTRLRRPKLEILSAGDVRTIEPDQALTHRVIHLENPTVTLCVKTLNETGLSQWHHFESGVAIKKRHVDPGHFKKAYYFQYLLETDEAEADAFLQAWMAPLDRSTRMNLCEDLSMGACDLPEASIQRILESACAGFENQEWFLRFQKSSMAQDEDIVITNDHSPELRLAVHFANTGWTYAEAQPWLDKVRTRSHSKTEMTRLVFDGLDQDHPTFELQQERWTKFIEN